MNVTVLRTYAIQLEEVAKLEVAGLAGALQQTVERMAMVDSRARAGAARAVGAPDRAIVLLGDERERAEIEEHVAQATPELREKMG